MKKLSIFLISILIFSCEKKETVDMNMDEMKMSEMTITEMPLYTLSEEGIDTEIGTITVGDAGENGISITVKATGLVPGVHGFHLHETNILTSTTNKNGDILIGGGAGGHWDPDNTGIHAGPDGNGHRGDLPSITIAEDGSIDAVVMATKIKFTDVTGKSFMIHAGGDTYSDEPYLGGGGARLYASPF